mgnify:CR=1 FL=1
MRALEQLRVLLTGCWLFARCSKPTENPKGRILVVGKNDVTGVHIGRQGRHHIRPDRRIDLPLLIEIGENFGAAVWLTNHPQDNDN